jgi:uncharacterized protein YegP (UPF0339 family)
MEFKLSEARVRELAQIEEEAGCNIGAGGGWDHGLARSIVNGTSRTELPVLSFVIYRDGSGRYRWRCTADNGKVVAESKDGYEDKTDCEAEIRWFQKVAPSSPIVA